MKLWNGRMEVKSFHGSSNPYLRWRWPRYYKPTAVYRHGFHLGPFVIWWARDFDWARTPDVPKEGS